MSCCDICDELDAIKAEQAWGREALTLLLLHAGLQVPGTGTPPAFEVDAVAFDGTDRLQRNSALTSVSDSGDFILSFWIKTTDVDFPIVLTTGVGTVSFTTYGPSVYDAAGANGFYAELDTTVQAGTWRHVLFAGRMSTSTLQTYVDGVDVSLGTNVDGTPSTADFDAASWAIMDSVGGGNAMTGDIAEIYFAPGQYLDISDSANVEKFRTVGGKPVDLGSDGSTPTGSAPAIYLSVRPGDAASDLATNRGTGGDFTITGTLAIAGTSPSD
jgi:hypothetical protein